MPPPAGGYQVDPELLASTGDKLVGVADEVHLTASGLSGESTALTGANAGFAVTRALAECEQAWEEALDARSVKIALHGDLLADNSQRYAETETRSAEGFTIRWDR